MRAIAWCILAVGLVVSPAIAGTGGAGSKESPAAASSKNAAAPAATPNAASPAKPAEPAMETELQQLRDALAVQAQQLQEQQQKMQLLEEQLKTSSAARENLEASAHASPAAAPANASLAGSSASSLGAAAPAPQQKEPKLGPIASQDFKIGATFYGNFSHYTDAGFGPAFQDLPTTQLGPGNSGLNTFEVTRAYINLFYTPNEHVTLRITPDIYRLSDGNLSFRLKYGFVDFQKIFGDGAFKNAKLTFGQTQQPLTDWEEGLSGYRYAYLTPWNYLSLSSTYVGAKLHGPIDFNGTEYLDYDIGVFTTASFHSTETNDKKQVMARLTWYPMGTTADRAGLGLTVFENYGYNTKLPSQKSTPLNRLSILAHYQTHNKAYQIAFEYQLGRNATSGGNMFSGSSPASDDPFYTLANSYILAGDRTRQQGFAVFGHARLGNSPFSLWGLYQHFQPNTNFDYASYELTANPLDFARTVGGIAYKVTDHFDVAFGDQNFHWLHPQGLAGPDSNGIVIWTQFNY
jgi:hypothetical protein